MAGQTANQETNAGTAKTGGSWLGKLSIAGFMGGVVAVECLLAYFMFPSPEQVAALAEKNLAKKLPANLKTEDASAPKETEKPTVEVDLGEYVVTVTQPNSATTLRVDFHLFGTASEEEEPELKARYERHLNRFRDQVLYEIRNSEPADLTDPGLALIKRRILEKSNALFGKPLLRSVVFSQFWYFEQ